jgi:Icc-related predicted phosphoesterase
LRHLFHLHFSLRHVLDGRKKPDDQDDHCALVSTKHLHVQDDRACQNLNERDGRAYQSLNALGDLVSQNLNEQDDPDEQNLHVQDARVSTKQGALDELLFQDVPILMNPNERGARCENDLVLD